MKAWKGDSLWNSRLFQWPSLAVSLACFNKAIHIHVTPSCLLGVSTFPGPFQCCLGCVKRPWHFLQHLQDTGRWGSSPNAACYFVLPEKQTKNPNNLILYILWYPWPVFTIGHFIASCQLDFIHVIVLKNSQTCSIMKLIFKYLFRSMYTVELCTF